MTSVRREVCVLLRKARAANGAGEESGGGLPTREGGQACPGLRGGLRGKVHWESSRASRPLGLGVGV